MLVFSAANSLPFSSGDAWIIIGGLVLGVIKGVVTAIDRGDWG